jgi:NTE family protein
MSADAPPPSSHGKIGLVLPGGGARAAYQVGVLRAIADLLPARSNNPFPIVTGTSAGAVNATAIAVHADRFRVAVGNLERVWRNFQVHQVFRADTASMLRSGLHWLLAMLSGGWLLPPPRSLFDNTPLRELLQAQFDFASVRKSIEAGHLDALAMSAAGYISLLLHREAGMRAMEPNAPCWRAGTTFARAPDGERCRPLLVSACAARR